MKTTLVRECSWLRLISRVNAKGRKTYMIIADMFKLRNSMDIIDVRSHFDPNRNRGGQYGCRWKFSNREDAEKLMVIAMLKWGS